MGGNWKWEKGERGKENKKEQESELDELEHSPSWKGILESKGRNWLLARVAGALWERDRLKKRGGRRWRRTSGPHLDPIVFTRTGEGSKRLGLYLVTTRPVMQGMDYKWTSVESGDEFCRLLPRQGQLWSW